MGLPSMSPGSVEVCRLISSFKGWLDVRVLCADAVVTHRPRRLDHIEMAERHQMIEMRDRLAHGEADLMTVKSGLEHHVDQIAGARFIADPIQNDVEPGCVMHRKLAQPVLHVIERLAM